jgi:hypothetical protein
MLFHVEDLNAHARERVAVLALAGEVDNLTRARQLCEPRE